MNREEALRCRELASKYQMEGNLPRALRLLQKSLDMHPDDKTRAQLEAVQAKLDAGAAAPRASATSESGDGLRQRRTAADAGAGAGASSPSASPSTGASSSASTAQRSGSTTSSSAPQRPFTKAQHDLVLRITRSKDYYEVLGVERTCDEQELSRAYRRLALKVHPDKNSAPGAEDAFKSVGVAYNVLNDAQKRRQYDTTGSVDGSGPGFGGEPTMEDLFNMFAHMQGNHAVPRGFEDDLRFHFSSSFRQRHRRRQDQGNNAGLLQFLPLLLLLTLSMFGNSGYDDAPFSLKKAGDYQIARRTGNEVSYYVKPTFDRDYGYSYTALQRVENLVDRTYVKQLQTQCFYERRAASNAKKASASPPMKACRRLQELQGLA